MSYRIIIKNYELIIFSYVLSLRFILILFLLTLSLYDIIRINFKDIEYEFGDEYLETIIKNYDPNANPGNSLVIIGENSFKKWDIPIEAYLLQLNVVNTNEKWKKYKNYYSKQTLQ